MLSIVDPPCLYHLASIYYTFFALKYLLPMKKPDPLWTGLNIRKKSGHMVTSGVSYTHFQPLLPGYPGNRDEQYIKASARCQVDLPFKLATPNSVTTRWVTCLGTVIVILWHSGFYSGGHCAVLGLKCRWTTYSGRLWTNRNPKQSPTARRFRRCAVSLLTQVDLAEITSKQLHTDTKLSIWAIVLISFT